MSGIRVEGSTSGYVAEVDSNNNLKTNLPTTKAQAGYAAVLFEHDAGVYTGTKEFKAPNITENGNLTAAQRSLLWHAMFAGTAQDTGKWKHLFTTMTTTQAGDGTILMNANLTATTATGCGIQSWKYFSCIDQATFSGIFQTTIINAHPVANQVMEWGFFPLVAATAPADGVYLRYTTAGLYGYIKFGANAEVASGLLLAANSLTLNQSYDFKITVDEREVGFYIGGDELGIIAIPNGQSNVFQNLSLPLCFQQRNSGALTGTQAQMKVSCTSVIQDDLALNKSWPEQMSGIGHNHQGADGGTMGGTAMYTNAALTAAAALANATAAANFVGLGGVALVLPTLTAGTDGILFSYLNPAGTTTQPGRSLVIHGVEISAAVQVILAGGPLVLVYSMAFGHTNISLATAEGASFSNNTTKVPRRLPIGVHSCVVTAAVGTQLTPLDIRLKAPVTINPGEFFAITCRNVATVTTTGALAISVGVDHHFE